MSGHNDYWIYKENKRILSKKDVDYYLEMMCTDNVLKKIWIWSKYKTSLLWRERKK